MKISVKFLIGIMIVLGVTSCVSKKQYQTMQKSLQAEVDATKAKYEESNNGAVALRIDNEKLMATAKSNDQRLKDLRDQLEDCKTQRDKQLTQVGDLTVLSQSANQNISETLSQLSKKDKYIRYLQDAKSKADSINLALSVNLKGVLKDGIEDQDVDVKVDKTVVYINLSDKMMYQSGSYNLTPRAREVLGKIALIIESRPDLEVMVEGYTDNVPITNSCMDDNWDLSVKRATSVVRTLQKEFKIDPNRLIAAGRGQYNTLVDNSTADGRATNRRTRIIILPKLGQFYDLLNPANAPK
ncbi:MAG: OmpA family protein [Bacteroidia bacterium]|nr:OmpA family protein [Bacteroidia bacterium]